MWIPHSHARACLGICFDYIEGCRNCHPTVDPQNNLAQIISQFPKIGGTTNETPKHYHAYYGGQGSKVKAVRTEFLATIDVLRG